MLALSGTHLFPSHTANLRILPNMCKGNQDEGRYTRRCSYTNYLTNGKNNNLIRLAVYINSTTYWCPKQ